MASYIVGSLNPPLDGAPQPEVIVSASAAQSSLIAMTLRSTPVSGAEQPQNSLKRITWQSENCLSCVWFRPNDPLNADLLERGLCVEPKMKAFELVVSGRDWCNLYKEVRQRQIDLLQEGKMKD